jgi:hypothetical protein
VTKFSYKISTIGAGIINPVSHKHNVADIADINSYIDNHFVCQTGTSNFVGDTGVQIPLQFVPGALGYEVQVQPSANPNGYLGEVWVVKGSDHFIVYNSGTATTSFRYRVADSGKDALIRSTEHKHMASDIEDIDDHIAMLMWILQ